MSKNISLWPLSAFCLTIVVVLAAASSASAQTPEEALEREAQAIDRMIMCPVCPAETIDQAQVEISFQMRAVIREMLAEGRTREEILDYFVDRYGADILAAPPKSGINLLAWVLPIIGIAAGLGALYLVVRSMTSRNQPAPATAIASPGDTSQALFDGASADGDADLSPYLEIVDRSLAVRRGIRPEAEERPRRNLPAEAEGNSAAESGDHG